MKLPQWLVPETGRDRLALLVIMAGAIALRWYGFRGFGAADDAAYAQIAHQIAAGTYHIGSYAGPAVFPLRVGIILPTALAFRVFGVSELSMVAVPLVLSLLSVLLAYTAACHFFGPRAGLVAAAIWAVLPIDVFHASILVPDLPAAFFASLGLLVVIMLGDGRASPRLLLVGGAAAGLSFGASWLCKESVAYAVPICAFLALRSWKTEWRRQVPLWGGVAAGSLAVLLGEALVYHAATGDWLYHVHETERNYHQYQNAFFVSGSALAGAGGSSYGHAVLRRILLDGPKTILDNARMLYLPLVGGVVALHALYRRDRAFLIPAVWLLVLGFMFNFASSSVRSYVPLVLFDRYLYPMFLPAVVLVAGLLAGVLWPPVQERAPRREGVFWGSLVVMGLLLLSAYQNHAYRRFAPGWAAEVRSLSRTLKPTDRVFTDILSIHGLEFFWSYPDSMNTVNFEDMSQAAPMRPGDYVLLNTSYLDWLTNMAGWWPTEAATYERPTFERDAPPSWERVWGNGNATLYQVR